MWAANAFLIDIKLDWQVGRDVLNVGGPYHLLFSYSHQLVNHREVDIFFHTSWNVKEMLPNITQKYPQVTMEPLKYRCPKGNACV